MLAHVPSKERIALAIIGGLVLVTLGFLGSRATRRADPITIEQQATDAPLAPTASAKTQPTEVVVDVTGAVKKPTVVHLAVGARVEDGIQAAGGAQPDADLESLNLAAKLQDGDQLYVPSKGKQDEPAKVSPTYQGGKLAPHAYQAHPEPAKTASPHSGGKHPTAPVSLNTASSEQLQTLPGVGPSTAESILDYRKEHGGFTTIDELMAVKGIGPKKMEKLRKWLKL